METASTVHTLETPAGTNGAPAGHCRACGQPDDDDVCAIAAEYRRYYPEWSSRRCFDRAWIAAAKGAKRVTSEAAALVRSHQEG